jgi:nucleoside-diphosphate-sugar epimerase
VAGGKTVAGRGILITGAAGFLGSHLTRALTAAGAEVHPFTRRIGDVTNLEVLRAAITTARPEVVFHLAAYGTTTTQRDVARMREVNVGGVENLWTALERFHCRIVQAGTCAEYAMKDGPISESDPCAPESGYAATLHEAVAYSQARAQRTGREVVVIRPFGPYGPGDRPERLIPFVIDGLLDGGRVAVTAGRQRRDFSYVSDHIAAFVAAATAPLTQTGAAYNIGSGVPISVRDVVEKVAGLVGDRASDRIDYGAVASRPDDSGDRYADISAARRDLAFAPAVGLDEGLQLTIAAALAARQEAAR